MAGMKLGVPWSVKGIEPQAREAAKDAAHRAGLTLGQWLTQMILDQDSDPGEQSKAEGPGESLSSSAEELSRRLDGLNRHFDAAPEEREPEPAGIARVPLPGQIQLRLERTDANVKLLQNEVEKIAESLRTQAPANLAGIQALERSLYEVVDHIELTDKRNADALKTIQARLSDLANRSLKEGSSVEDQESRKAIAALQDKVGDLVRRVEHAERSGGNTHSALEKKVAALAAKVDSARTNPAMEAIEARLNQVTTKLSAAERTMTPQSEFHQVKSEISKLRSDMSRPREPIKPTVVHAIEARLKSLDNEMSGIRSSVASTSDVRKLGERLEGVIHRMNRSEDALRSVDRISSFETQLNNISRRLESSLGERAAHPQIGALERRVDEIASRIDSAGDKSMPAIAELERQINEISTRLETAESQFSTLDSIENNLAQIFDSIGTSRQAAIDAAEQAALNAVQSISSRSTGSNDIATGEALTALERGLAEVKSQAATADQQNQEALEAIHDTLKRVIERIGQLEDRGQAEAKEPNRIAEGYAISSDFDTESDPGNSEFEEFQLPPLPEVTDDESTGAAPQEPPSPDRNERAVAAESPTPAESPSPGESTEFARAYDEPEPAKSHNEDFIAAARKAARAASQAQDDLDPPLEADEDNRSTKSMIGRFRNRKRALLFAAAVVFITTGMLSLTGVLDQPLRVLGARSASTAEGPSKVTATPAATSDAAVPAGEAESSQVNLFAGEVATAARTPEDKPAQSAPRAGAKDATSAEASETVDGTSVADATPVITIAPPRENTRETVLAPRAASTGLAGHRLPGSVTTHTGAIPSGREEVVAIAVNFQPTSRPSAPPSADQSAPQTLMQAAEAGDAAAQFEIATRYADGRAGRKNPSEAATWYQRAAAQGLAPAQYRLGALYEKGQGVPQDKAAAQIWYQRAAEQGNVKAMHNLAVLLAGGTGGNSDYARAARWFLKAAELGLADSQYNLAVLHERGLGIERNPGSAYKWFAIAAAKGDAEAEKRMNELAGELDPDKLAQARAAYQSWRAAPLDRSANFVEPPEFADDADELKAATAFVSPTTTSLVARAQELLAVLGYDAGPFDGVVGPRTKDAIRAFERERGLPETGEATPLVVQHLESAIAG